MNEKKLKILNVVPLPTYEPKDGGAINFLNRNYLLTEKNHVIDFLIFKETAENCSNFEISFADKILTIKLKNKIKSIFKSFLSKKPYIYFRHDLDKEERFKLSSLIKKNGYDIVLFETIRSYPVYELIKEELREMNIPVAYFAHNIDYIDVYNNSKNSKNLVKKIFLSIESFKDKLIEHKFIKKFTLIFSISPMDIKILRNINEDARIVFVPAIINFFTNKNKACDISSHKYKILFTGSLSYDPNIKAAVWFSEKVMPILRQKIKTCFLIIGRNPTREILYLKKKYKDIFIFANVDSLTPFYEIADLVVIPLFNNAGVKIKLIEALKYKKMVVSRPEGVYGSGLSELIPKADTPTEFAIKCINTLEGKIDFNPIWKKFDEIYDNEKIILDMEKELLNLSSRK